MRFFLVYPQINSAIVAYSYGVGYLISVLKQAGHETWYFSLENAGDIRLLLEKARDVKPEVIGISLLSAEAGGVVEIFRELRRISDACIICGGTHPTLMPESLLDFNTIDAIVRGEGETAIVEFAAGYEKGGDYHAAPNFWFRRNDDIVKNDVCPPVDVNTLPFPDKTSLDYQRIIDMYDRTNRFLFNRGCPFDCPYCSNKAQRELYANKGRYFRLIKPSRAIEEIETDSRRFNFDRIFFDDDLITINKEWFYDFFTLYRRHFKYPFWCNVRAGTIDEDMIELLKDAGAEGIAMGIEQGNETYRKNVLRRDIGNRTLIDSFDSFKRHGIPRAYGHVMVGLPFETMDLFLESVELYRKLNIGFYLSIFVPYPGTEFWRICSEKGWLVHGGHSLRRDRAAIDYPLFRKQDIQLCYRLFPFLVRYRFLPLRVKFVPAAVLFRFYGAVFSICLFAQSVKEKCVEIIRRVKSRIRRRLQKRSGARTDSSA